MLAFFEQRSGLSSRSVRCPEDVMPGIPSHRDSSRSTDRVPSRRPACIVLFAEENFVVLWKLDCVIKKVADSAEVLQAHVVCIFQHHEPQFGRYRGWHHEENGI